MTMSGKTKILFLANTMNLGGVEVSLLALLRALPAESFDIHLGLLRPGNILDEEIPATVTVHHLTDLAEYLAADDNPLKSSLNDLRHLRLVRCIRTAWATMRMAIERTRIPYYERFIRREFGAGGDGYDYDVVVSYAGPSEILDWYASCRVKARRRVGWIHFDVEGGTFDRYETSRRAYSRFDRIFVVSESGRQAFCRKYPMLAERTEVFHNLVDAQRVKRLGEEAVAPLPSGVKRVVTIGRLQDVKGQDLAIRAARILKDRGVAFIWQLIGIGPHERMFRDLATELDVNDVVSFEGLRRNPYPYMRQADVYVQTSYYEGYCISLAEAKCFDAPIVTTRFAGSEQVAGRPACHIVSQDPQAIADAVEQELSSHRRGVPDENNDSENELSNLISFFKK